MVANDLSRAIELTEQMLEQLEAGDWEGLDALDRQRLPMIRASFEQNTDDIDVEAVARLKELNDRIVSGLSRQRRQTREEQLRMQQGQQAARQYQLNERG